MRIETTSHLAAAITAALALALALAPAANAEIVILDDLSDGSPVHGTLPFNAGSQYMDPENWDYYILFARKGDSIRIRVDRTVANLDPGAGVFFGNAAGQPFDTFGDLGPIGALNGPARDEPGLFDPIAAGDDDDTPATGNGPGGDPDFFFAAPATGPYTVAVASLGSGALPPTGYTYTVRATGSSIPAPITAAALAFAAPLARPRRDRSSAPPKANNAPI